MRIHIKKDENMSGCGLFRVNCSSSPLHVTCPNCRRSWAYRERCEDLGLVEIPQLEKKKESRWLSASEAIETTIRAKGEATVVQIAEAVGVTSRRVRQVLTANPAYKSTVVPGKGSPRLWSLR